MSGQIKKNDIIDEEALKVFSEIVTEFKTLVDSAKNLKKSLKNSGLNETGSAADSAKKSIFQLNNATREFNSLMSLQKQKQKETTDALIAGAKNVAAAEKKATDAKKKDISERIASYKRMVAFEKKAAKEKEVLDRKANANAKLLLNARNTEAGSLTRLNAVNQLYKNRMNELNVLIPAQAKQYARLSQSIQNNEARMMSMAKTAGVGTRKFNMLQWQIMQVSREMPAFAYGINVGIGALSNNLPMLFDEINNVRKANKLLAADGEKTTPVLKQIAKSLFSWQTALVAAVTIFTLYGEEIATWAKELFAGKEKVDALKISQEKLKIAMDSGAEASVNATTKTKILYNATQDQTKSMDDRIAAVDELQKMYPSYFGNMSNEAILAGNASEQYANLRKSIIEKAKAQAYANEISKNAIEIYKLEQELSKAIAKQDEASTRLKMYQVETDWSRVEVMNAQAEATRRATKDYQDASTEVGNVVKKIGALADTNKKLEGLIDISDWVAEFKELSGSVKDLTDEALGGSWLIDTLATAKDVYDAHYVERLSMARDNAMETVDIEREMVLNQLKNNSELTLTERQKLLAQLRLLDDEHAKIISDDKIASTYEMVNEEAVVMAEAATAQYEKRVGFAEKRRLIEIKLSQSLLQLEADALQSAIDSGDLTVSEEQKAADRILAINENLEKGKRALSQETKELILENLDEASKIASTGFEIQQMFSDNQSQRAEDRYNRDVQLAGDSESAKLVALRKFEKEKRKIEKRQAKAKKAQAIFDIGVDVAKAIVEYGIISPQAILAGIVGAATLAAVVAKPLPQFAEGVENFGGGLAIVGDKKGEPTKAGGSELLLFPDGRKALSPSTPTIMNLPSGTDVIPHDETTRILANQAMNSTSSYIDMSSTDRHLMSIDKNTSESTTYVDGVKIVKKKNFTGRYR